MVGNTLNCFNAIADSLSTVTLPYLADYGRIASSVTTTNHIRTQVAIERKPEPPRFFCSLSRNAAETTTQCFFENLRDEDSYAFNFGPSLRFYYFKRI